MMIRKCSPYRSWTLPTSLGLVLSFLLLASAVRAAGLVGREFLGPVHVEVGDQFQVALANVWSVESSYAVVRIFDKDANVVSAFGTGPKEDPLPVEIAAGDTQIVSITADDTPGSSTPPGEYTAIAELYSANGTKHAPLLSAQIVDRDGSAGIWGTGGVALNAIWGTGGVARTGIWGTGGVARSGIWGTGGVAVQKVVGAFPLVNVTTNERYRLIAQNPYDDPIQIRMLAVEPDGNVLRDSFIVTLNPGKTTVFDASGGGGVIGIIELIANNGGEAGPLVTMQVVRGDGKSGIWGTGGVAYEADAIPALP